MTWDNTLYNVANDYVAKSWERWESGQLAESWGYAFSARLIYLCDLVVNCVILPFAIIGVTFGTLHAIFTLNYRSPIFQKTKNFIMEKTNHIFMSACGSFISPAIAHRYRDANLAPYFLALRITILAGGFVYYFFSR